MIKKFCVLLALGFITLLAGCVGENLNEKMEISAATASATITRTRVPTFTSRANLGPIPTRRWTKTPMPTPTSRWPTLIYESTATAIPDGVTVTAEPTSTAPPRRASIPDLPDNMYIEEYPVDSKWGSGEGSSRHPDKGGRFENPNGGMIGEKLFIAEGSMDSISAFLGEEKVLMKKCPMSPVLSVITAWTYQDHWIIQSHCDGFDIYWDGELLNERNGYQESFAFQIMDGKPFYLFRREDKI